MMTALGFIETLGLLPAIEAADAMLKAADVRLVDKSLASGGLVTITVTGEVAAVQASVDAGAASVGRIYGATLVSKHVIARPDAELSKIIDAKKAAPKAPAQSAPKAQPAPAAVSPAPAKAPEAAPKAAAPAPVSKPAAPAPKAAKKSNTSKKKR